MRLRYKPNAEKDIKENPLMTFTPEDYRGRWKEVFGNDRPIYLEIGAGKGEFTYGMAKENKDINFVALEMSVKAFVLAARLFDEEKTPNIRGIVGDANDLTEIFSPCEIDKIYLNFSTPWPKRRHHKRRLTNKNFLKLYETIIKKGGLLELKTDNREFFDDSLKYIKDYGLEILEKSYDLSIEDSGVQTDYEEKFRKKKVPICFVRARFNK